MITGMLAATALAIFVIPVLFVLMERLASRRALPHLAPQPGISEGVRDEIVAGCSSSSPYSRQRPAVGPDYKRPPATIPVGYRAPLRRMLAGERRFAGRRKWWDVSRMISCGV